MTIVVNIFNETRSGGFLFWTYIRIVPTVAFMLQFKKQFWRSYGYSIEDTVLY